MTRGHKSHIGAGFVIDNETGFILDFEVLSNQCVVCERKQHKKKLTDAEFEVWKNSEHKSCSKHFEGKSGEMEAECATRMWLRSTQKGVR